MACYDTYNSSLNHQGHDTELVIAFLIFINGFWATGYELNYSGPCRNRKEKAVDIILVFFFRFNCHCRYQASI